MITIDKQDLESSEPHIELSVSNILEFEDKIWLKLALARMNKAYNKRKKQRRARTGRR